LPLFTTNSSLTKPVSLCVFFLLEFKVNPTRVQIVFLTSKACLLFSTHYRFATNKLPVNCSRMVVNSTDVLLTFSYKYTW